jgi:hypothetical protein
MTSAFPIIPSTIDVHSEQFLKYQDDWNSVLNEHRKSLEWCVSEGQEKYVQRHIERGMLLSTPKKRISLTIKQETE